jgi:hypothetical protein
MNLPAYFGVFDLALTRYFPAWSVRGATGWHSERLPSGKGNENKDG